MTTTPRLAFITIVTTLVYLGLAILGWGGFAAAGRDLRSLLVGYYQAGKLVLAGKVGTGFTLESGRAGGSAAQA
jgi:hypothetical protein